MDIFSEIDAMPGLLAFMNENSFSRCLDHMTASAIACSRAPFPIRITLIMVFLLAQFFAVHYIPMHIT
ncbi:MAG: hypothetical protein ACXWMW_13290, partial [Syntrophales bacterium]